MAVDHMECDIHGTAQPAPAGSLFETFADRVLNRVHDVLAGRDCLIPPTDLQKIILFHLGKHQGERRAVTREAWVHQLNMPDREIRAAMQSLRQDYGVAIASSSAGGYYLVETEEEFGLAVRALRLQAVTILRVVQGMNRGRATIDDMLHQLRLELSEEVR